MRKSDALFWMCCVFLTAIVSVSETVAQTNPAPEESHTAAELYDLYTIKSLDANAAADKHEAQVDTAKAINDDIDKNRETLSDTTATSLKNLFSAVGIYAVGAKTLFIPALGQVQATLAWVEAKLEENDLEALKALADQAVSDAHRRAINFEAVKTKAYDEYIKQFSVENPSYGEAGYSGPTPLPPTQMENSHDNYVFSCPGGCGRGWDLIEPALRTHLSASVCGAEGVSGCGKSFYTCDPQHIAVSCTNFIGAPCPIQFRPCSNSDCTPGSLWRYPIPHSARPQQASETSVRYFCPQCNEEHGE